MPWVQYVGKRSLAGDVLGANLISSGHFTDGTTGWTGSNATLSKTADGKLRVTVTAGTANSYAFATFTTTTGTLYRVDADFYRGTGSSSFVSAYDTSSGNVLDDARDLTVDGSHTFYFVAIGTTSGVRLYAHSGASTTGQYNEFDNVKVRAVQVRGHATDIEHIVNPFFRYDSQWTKGTGWTIGSGVATGAAGSASDLAQGSAIKLRTGKTYDTSFTVGGSVAGSLYFVFYSPTAVTGTARSSTGTYTETITTAAGGSTASFAIQKNAAGAGTVDNVSVKLAADNTWTLDFDISSLQYGRDQNIERVQMMDRSTDSQYFGAKNLISVTTDILAYGEWQFMEEFLDNAVDGQTVTFDPFGTESQPKAPGSYILVGSGITHIVGADTTERRQYQLQFRQA